MKSLSGKTAIVTGAASGIGRSCAGAMAERGIRVVAVDISEEPLKALAADVMANGGEILPLAIDIGIENSFDVIRARAMDVFGPVDILMNNVGVLISGKPEDIPLTEWQRVINLNLMATIRAVHLFIPEMIARGEGHIVNTASFAGLFPYAWDRLPYAAAKAAVIALSEGLALYLKPQGIGVTCLCPGPVRTNIGATRKVWTEGMAPRGPGSQFRMMEPEEVAAQVIEAIERDVFFLPTDDQVLERMQARARDPEAFLTEQIAAMQAD